MLKRQCTKEHKIEPIRKEIRRLLGVAPRKHVPTDITVEQWYGISGDELRRVRMSQERWIDNHYPLIFDFKPPMTRAGCYDWLAKHYPDHPVPRSACVGCPYRSNQEWRTIKDNEQEWRDATEFDDAIRSMGGTRGDAFIHRSYRPLKHANLDEDQMEMWSDECLGHCGV